MKIDNTNVYNIAESIVASGFPMRTDDPTITWSYDVECVKEYLATRNENYSEKSKIGKAHFDRITKLGNAKAGSGHDCGLKGIVVTANITASKVFWSQWQRYHFQDIVSSMSFMHRLTKMNIDNCGIDEIILNRFKELIKFYNEHEWETKEDKDDYFEYIIDNVPAGIELTAHIVTNYLQLKTIYSQRKYHKTSSWNDKFKLWCENLPYFIEMSNINKNNS